MVNEGLRRAARTRGACGHGRRSGRILGADGDGPERLPKLNFRKENETSTEIGLADVKEKIAEVDERIERGEEPVITPKGGGSPAGCRMPTSGNLRKHSSRTSVVSGQGCASTDWTGRHCEMRAGDSEQDRTASITRLALGHGLTVYDASYLELALRHGLPLATRDTALIAAARTLGLPVLP